MNVAEKENVKSKGILVLSPFYKNWMEPVLFLLKMTEIWSNFIGIGFRLGFY